MATVVAVEPKRFHQIKGRLRHEARRGAVVWLSGVDQKRVAEVNSAGIANGERDWPIQGFVQLPGELQE